MLPVPDISPLAPEEESPQLQRAVKADKRVASAEKGLRFLRGLAVALVITLLMATTTFSAIAAFQAKNVASITAQQQITNHKTGLQNQQILTQIHEATSHHTQTINTLTTLQKDLDHKFNLIVKVDQAACRNAPKTVENNATCRALDQAVKAGLKTRNTHSP